MSRVWIIFVCVLVWMSLLLASCAVFQPESRPLPKDDLPDAFSLFPEQKPPSIPWWKSFGSEELNRLIRTALSDNLNLKQFWARLEQTGAQAVKARADTYPRVTGSAGTTLAMRRFGGGGSVQTDTTHNISASIVGNYEVDLWGRVRAEQQAAALSVERSREDLDAAALSIAAEVAVRWVRVISQRIQKKLLEVQLATNETYLELVELRFRNAMATALDVFQQREMIAGIKAQLPPVWVREKQLLHELAFLMGKPPLSDMGIRERTLPEPDPVVSTGIPADLLTNRPDVRAAGLRLQAAEWQTAAARANRLPAFRLSATARNGPAEFNDLFDNWLLNLAANLAAPLFDGHNLDAEVDRRKAVGDEKFAAYREAVLTAVKEVEDALVVEDAQRRLLSAMQEQLDISKMARTEAVERYRRGLNDYLPVLTQILSVQRLERNLVMERTNLVLARIGLYRALGGANIKKWIGGWLTNGG